MMKGIKEVSWKSAKGMMSEANFLKSLKEMNVDAITAGQLKIVKGTITIHYFSPIGLLHVAKASLIEIRQWKFTHHPESRGAVVA